MRFTPVLTALLIFSCASTSNLREHPKVWTYEEALEIRQRLDRPFIEETETSWLNPGLECDPSFSFFPFFKEGSQRFPFSIQYPAEDRLAIENGELIISFVVNVHGQAEDIRVVRSLSPSIDTQMKRNIQRAEYVPGFCNKELQAARHRISMKFSLTTVGL